MSVYVCACEYRCLQRPEELTLQAAELPDVGARHRTPELLSTPRTASLVVDEEDICQQLDR